MEQAKKRILIVDDMPSNIKVLNDILKDDYAISVATNGRDALEVATGKNMPDLILLDVMMPEMDGYEVCRRLKLLERTKDIPILFVTAMSDVQNEAKGLEMGAADYITKPISPSIVRARVRNHMLLKNNTDHLEDLVRRRTEDLALTQEATIQCMASLAETRDNETGGHIMRTQRYVRVLALGLAEEGLHEDLLDQRGIELMYKSAPLHDIGKVGVPDSILLKPGRLSDEEFETMKLHTVYGKEAIERAEEQMEGRTTAFLRFAKEIAFTHHERWDGSGYPTGIAGEEIPLGGRLMAVADVYDALVTRRVYKPPFPHSKALEIISAGRGNHFDPQVADLFGRLEKEFKKIALEFVDLDEEREMLEK